VTVPSRTLTVAHQQPGECGYCDDRHDRIVAAVARELAAAPPADVEHCVHSRAIHHRHHQQPVTGCPWCVQPGTTLIDPGDLL
jgi:hypothetical protein